MDVLTVAWIVFCVLVGYAFIIGIPLLILYLLVRFIKAAWGND